MFFKFLTMLLLFVISNYPQYMIMTYNLLDYPGTNSSIRNPYFRTIISNTEPDILVVQEILSQAGVNEFLDSVLNIASIGYVAGTFIDGTDSDNAIFYQDVFFTFVSNRPIKTALRDINEFTLIYNATGDTLRIYSVHLKSSAGSGIEQLRAAEIDSLRKVTDALPPGAQFIVTGDFNIYGSQEPAYIKLLDQTSSGYVLDPVNSPGYWHSNESFAWLHTQSSRTRQFGDGAVGGMDDRFDMILVSQAVMDIGGISYFNNSYIAYGNDGDHYNDSINAPPNWAVGQEIANAIHYASDHIPVFALFYFEPNGVEDEITITNFRLYQSYPNPFNPVTTIKYQIPELSLVTLKVYDILGNEIVTLVNEEKSAGEYKVEFSAKGGTASGGDAYNLPSGVYFYQLKAGEYIKTKKMVLMK